MKLLGVAILAATTLWVVLVSAQGTKTITGEVVDVSCYTAEGARGAAHRECAAACIKGGQPAGILEDSTGLLYVVVTGDHSNPATRVMPHVAKFVEATGVVHERGGIRTIDVKEIREVPTEKK